MTINQRIKIGIVFLVHSKIENGTAHQITRHINLATSFALRDMAYILEPLGKIEYTWKIFINEKNISSGKTMGMIDVQKYKSNANKGENEKGKKRRSLLQKVKSVK